MFQAFVEIMILVLNFYGIGTPIEFKPFKLLGAGLIIDTI